MERWLGPYAEAIYAVTRVVIGVLFACHGAQKLFGMFGGQSQLGNPLMATAGVIELVCGLLVALGLLAGYAAFVASGQMAVAYFMAHASGGFWPIVNKGELAVVYCFVFLYIAAKGAGRFSLDAILRKSGSGVA
jgi:putative oxidoreductase